MSSTFEHQPALYPAAIRAARDEAWEMQRQCDLHFHLAGRPIGWCEWCGSEVRYDHTYYRLTPGGLIWHGVLGAGDTSPCPTPEATP